MFTPFFTLCPYWVRLYSCFSLQHSLQEKGCCRGLYSTHTLSHGPISIQQLYSAVERCRALQLYSGSTVYRLYTLPLQSTPSWCRARSAAFISSFSANDRFALSRDCTSPRSCERLITWPLHLKICGTALSIGRAETSPLPWRCCLSEAF